MFCNKCGKQLADDDVYCSKCGAKCYREKESGDDASQAKEEALVKDQLPEVVNQPKPEHKAPQESHAGRKFAMFICISTFVIAISYGYVTSTVPVAPDEVSPQYDFMDRVQAALGVAEAQYKVGMYCPPGDSVTWLEKAANNGHIKAMRELAMQVKDGVKWITKAAESGDAESQYELGCRYDYGIGVLRDEKVAVEWYNKAAKQNHAKALNNLGVCYYYGIGVDKNEKNAFAYYKRASDLGYVKATNNLAFLYFEGRGTDKDVDKAVALYKIVANIRLDKTNYEDKESVGEAAGRLGFLYLLGLHIKRNDAEGIKYLELGKDLGDVFAIRMLGLCYRWGWANVERDYDKALQLLKKAADRGDDFAKKEYSKMLEYGY